MNKNISASSGCQGMQNPYISYLAEPDGALNIYIGDIGYTATPTLRIYSDHDGKVFQNTEQSVITKLIYGKLFL